MRILNKSLFLIASILFATTVCAADYIYEWKDSQGRTNYTDTPPATGIEYKRILRTSTSGSNAAAAQQSIAEKEMAFKERQQAAEKTTADAAEERKKAEQLEQQCAQTRERLETLKSNTPLVRRGTDGKIAEISTAERDAAIKKSEELLAEHCK